MKSLLVPLGSDCTAVSLHIPGPPSQLQSACGMRFAYLACIQVRWYRRKGDIPLQLQQKAIYSSAKCSIHSRDAALKRRLNPDTCPVQRTAAMFCTVCCWGCSLLLHPHQGYNAGHPLHDPPNLQEDFGFSRYLAIWRCIQRAAVRQAAA